MSKSGCLERALRVLLVGCIISTLYSLCLAQTSGGALTMADWNKNLNTVQGGSQNSNISIGTKPEHWKFPQETLVGGTSSSSSSAHNSADDNEDEVEGNESDEDQTSDPMIQQRQQIDWNALMDSRNWDKSSMLGQMSNSNANLGDTKSSSYNQGGSDPLAAGFLCNMDGVSINSPFGYIYQMYNPEEDDPAFGAGMTSVGCLWIIDLPADIEDPLVSIRVRNFSSTVSASLKMFSGTSTCDDKSGLYAKMQLTPLEGELASITENFVFIPAYEMAVAIQLTLETEGMDGDLTFNPAFALSIDFFTMNGHSNTLETLPNGEKGVVGPLSIFDTDNYTRVSEYFTGDMDGVSWVDGGLYIINNYGLESLEGLDEITSVNGPIVIRNNVHLMTSLSWVVDWLNGLSGNISSIDLSFNRFSGEVPESLCDIVGNEEYKLTLRNNMLLCGNLPECLHLHLGDDYEPWQETQDVAEGHAEKNEEEDTIFWTPDNVQLGSDIVAGNSFGMSCEEVENEMEVFESEDRSLMGCSPLGYMGDLDESGSIIFDHRGLMLQESNPPSCAWSIDLDKFMDYVLYLDYTSLYTMVSGDRGSACNGFSSGHNFHDPLLNGPCTKEFVVSLYNDTYRRGFEMAADSGNDIPTPFVLTIDDKIKSVELALKEKNTWQDPPDLIFNNATEDDDDFVQCGTTIIDYHLVKPISSVSALEAFVKEHLDVSTGVLNDDLIISNCTRTMNLNAMAEVRVIEGNFAISRCPYLSSLSGLENLTQVGGSITFTSSGFNNMKFNVSLSGLRSLQRVNRSITFYGLELRNFDGLQNLTSIGQNLEFVDTSMENFYGLENLLSIGSALTIIACPNIKNMKGLSSLTEVGTIVVTANEKLSDFAGLEFLSNIKGSVDIQYNPALRDLSGLDNVVTIGGTVGILNNAKLKSLSGLSKLKSVTGSFVVSNNDALQIVNLPSLGFVGLNASLPNSVNTVTDHVLSVSYNLNLRNFSFPALEKAPTNVLITGNEKLSGFLPTYFIAMDYVLLANFAYNNFSGPVDPSICAYGDRFQLLQLSGNQYLCGSLPQCNVNIQAADTNLFGPCPNTSPPICTMAAEEGECYVSGKEYSSNPNELFFSFPKYEVPSKLSENFNTKIDYRFGVGTKPGSDDVYTFTDMTNIIVNDTNENLLQHAWNLADKHISMVNGQQYYVTVEAYDTLGVSSENITSSGTLIDMLPPNVKFANVKLKVDPDAGEYKVDWDGFVARSGIDKYQVKLYRNNKGFQKTIVSGQNDSVTESLEEGDVQNGTTFYATVIGVSGSGLYSNPVSSNIIIPKGGTVQANSKTTLAVALGVFFGALVTAAVVAFFVVRHLQKQKKENQKKEWLQKLNNSVYTYLQGTNRGQGSEDDVESIQSGLLEMSRNNTKEAIFVFTDIEGSTKLCEQDAQVFIELQETHDEIMRNALAETGGHEVDTEGDAFQCLFHDAAHAMNFCFMVQSQLLQYDWPISVLTLKGCEKVKSRFHTGKYIWRGPKVRMAVHFGCSGDFLVRSHPTTRRLTFGGIAWDITKMLSDVGHGGQVLVSETAWKQLVNAGAEGAAGYPIFEDLGCYQLNCHDSPSMRILQASPARSPLSERRFAELRDVLMLDQGRGLNIVSPPHGKVALIALVFNEVFKLPLHDYLDELGLVQMDNVSRENSPYGSKLHSNRKLSKDLSLNTPKVFSRTDGQKDLESAFAIVESVLVSLVSQFGGYIVPSVEGNRVPRGCMVIAFKSSSAAVRFALASQTTLMEYPWPQDILNLPGMKQVTSREDGTPFFIGPRIAMSGHVEIVEKYYFTENKLQRSPSMTDNNVSYKSTGLLEALELAYMSSGGQIILSSKFFDSHWQKGLSLSQTHITDLGVHDVRYFDNPLNLIEILPKVLEERSGSFPPVPSERMLSVGAREAPGRQGEKIALVFTYPKVAHTFQRSSHASCAVDNFSESVRVLLSRYNGYESQEVGTGCFFLSFPSLEDALAWSVHIQLILRRSDWNNAENLIEDFDAEELNSDELSSGHSYKSDGLDTLFSFGSDSSHKFPTMSLNLKHFLLAQIGIVYGSPTKVTSHVQTGRADYFGPIVNLTARIAKATDPGDIHMSSSQGISSMDSCALKGTEFISGGQVVKIELVSCGQQSFKGVKEKHEVQSLRICGDPFQSNQKWE